MPPTSGIRSIWGSCRFALRSTSASPLKQSERIASSIVPRRRHISHDASQQPPPPYNSTNPASSSSHPTSSPQYQSSGQASTLPPSSTGTEGSSDEDISDAAMNVLEELIRSEGKHGSDIPGGLTEAQTQTLFEQGFIPPQLTGDPVHDALVTEANGGAAGGRVGHKFPLPELPLAPGNHLKYRYHPVLHQATNVLMREGKLARAQRQIAQVLNYLQTSATPNISPKYPLLAGAPPPVHLPLNPILYFTLAIDSIAPIVRILRLRGLMGGGGALELPQPLPLRQRRRMALRWIIDSVEKKASMGSGRKQFSYRFAQEIIAVIEGRSAIWEKRTLLHKQATAARANMLLPQFRAKK